MSRYEWLTAQPVMETMIYKDTSDIIEWLEDNNYTAKLIFPEWSCTEDYSNPTKGWFIDPEDGCFVLQTSLGDVEVVPGDVIVRLYNSFYVVKGPRG